MAAGIPRLAADERIARHAGFWWGLGEGLVFFIVPDVYISFATASMYVLTTVVCVPFVDFLDSIPGISRGLIDRVGATLVAAGLPFTPFLVLGGVPLKVYTALAFSLNLSLGSVLLWTVFARIARIAPTFVLVATLRLLMRRRTDAHPVPWHVLYSITWLAFYAWYFVHMSRV